MKNRILKNLGLKILAVICAVILWLVVINISDYSITKEIDDIPVTQLNGDALDELDKIYDVAKGSTVDIVVKGRRSVVSDLSASDFIATADLSTMSITNSVQIFVSAKSALIREEITINCVDNTMVLNLEEKVSNQFPVTVAVKNAPKDGYAVGETYTTPNIVTVEGPKSTVEKITSVVVNVDVTGKVESFDSVGGVRLLDAYGEEINNDKISISDKTVNVNVNIYPVKSVPVEINLRGNPENGYEVAEVNFQPQSVLVAGLEDNLKLLEVINIDDISVSGLSSNYETTVKLEDYLPEGIIIAQNTTDIVINIVIEKVITKNIALDATNIELRQKNSGYDYIVEFSDDFSVTIKGLTDAVNGTTIEKMTPYIDCSKLIVGSNKGIELKFAEIDGITYQITGTMTIKVVE